MWLSLRCIGSPVVMQFGVLLAILALIETPVSISYLSFSRTTFLIMFDLCLWFHRPLKSMRSSEFQALWSQCDILLPYTRVRPVIESDECIVSVQCLPRLLPEVHHGPRTELTKTPLYRKWAIAYNRRARMEISRHNILLLRCKLKSADVSFVRFATNSLSRMSSPSSCSTVSRTVLRQNC